MKERDFQKIFKNINKEFGAFELKLARKGILPFKAVADHQIEALLKISGDEGLYYKINDSPWTQKFTQKKPFDCFNLKGIPAYVVIIWYVPRKKKEFHYIAIQDFLAAKKQSTRKSLTEFVSSKIASQIERA